MNRAFLTPLFIAALAGVAGQHTALLAQHVKPAFEFFPAADESMASTHCRYCRSSSYGRGCSYSPHGAHEHTGTADRCEFCGSSSYGRGCSYSPTRAHRHGQDGRKCRWCGSASVGRGCSYSPTGAHERQQLLGHHTTEP